ncbi:STAS domain-containing protein [Pseudanabaena sp. UWO311]|uniref:STAS domain-containing protein n=1 Tax=Pseudanabaena sp. UWO311 TaxID=2487337 RepID=UPI001158C792|nr:STAS domain-containing protein [Pseudanabaena sp. UWO311]TYQ25221.1 STAS domain-containing protein [Pseudanabaena sp. UWO311]
MNESISVFQPEGIIDSVGGNQIRQDVGDRLEAGVETILIDLTNISFMDSSGLGAMVVTLQRVRSKGAKLYLCSLNDQIKIILELTKMDKVFDILPDRAAFDALIA